jgi:beta-phosphoglucomutase-like phosphatase (HAD superfamily)
MGADPARRLVIEDSLTGIRAGRAAGMAVWRFTGGSHLTGRLEPEPPDAVADRRCDGFAGFFQIDARLSGSPP